MIGASEPRVDVAALFAAETAERLDVITGALLALEGRRDEESVHAIFRALHTIKGNAQVIGADGVAELAHLGESVVALIREGSIEPEKSAVDSLLRLADAIAAEAARRRYPDRHTLVETLSTMAARAESVRSAGGRERGPAPTPGFLVACADLDARMSAVRALKPFGACDIAADGDEAAKAFEMAFQDSPYAALFVEAALPKVDGFELTRRVRGLEGARLESALRSGHTPPEPTFRLRSFIAILGGDPGGPPGLQACLASDADAYLPLPASSEAYTLAAGKALARRDPEGFTDGGSGG
jgi:CheY-like chemotaxis protein/HPt (histidine-containing phosphotransfer) domain-containing protein